MGLDVGVPPKQEPSCETIIHAPYPQRRTRQAAMKPLISSVGNSLLSIYTKFKSGKPQSEKPYQQPITQTDTTSESFL